MANYEELKDIQIIGACVQSILDGFGHFTLLASKILLESGLGTVDKEGVGVAQLEPNTWYPLAKFLTAFERVGAEFGDYTLRQVGIQIPKKAVVPPEFYKDINTAFVTMDMGYHLNHAKGGAQMGNFQTMEMLEGIGHFAAEQVPNKKQIIVRVDTPYPCAFDEGITIGLAQHILPTATLVHDRATCRKRGDKGCNYIVSWK
ncbi:hypothetical protein [Hyalangium versicolor]|uniref:hypothetical protein n=1 Tax=Hyalangium versicolor TaxID=2861190 RepID=UPI001CCFED89|nr:hypothetical protein [Hyalangium versicolor]